MDIVLTFFGVVIVIGLGLVLWKILTISSGGHEDIEKERLRGERDRFLEESIRLQSDLEKKLLELGQITVELAKEKEEKNEAIGKSKQLWAQNEKLQNTAEHLQTENNEIKKQISRFEAEKERKEKEFLEKIEKLEHSREKLEKEQIRVIREDEEKQKQMLLERDRLWNNHENEVVAMLREICQKPEMGFRCFDNNTLPETFDGTFKPDFLVEFLGQYLYFDAKVSRSENLQNYLQNQFKTTIIKLKKNPQIYKSIFFIVPTEAISTLKKRSESMDGYTFYVVSPESLEPVLASYRRITEYENLKDLDPQERENMVDVLAKFEHFIRNQNTANILFAEKAFEVLSERSSLSAAFQKELELSVKNLKYLKFKDSDFKRLSENIEEQQGHIVRLTTPQVLIPKKDLHEVRSLFQEE